MKENLFPDYDLKIKQNSNLFLFDYTKQYGEEYKDLLNERYHQVKWCLFENPRRLKGYIQTKSEDIGKKMTLDFLKKIRVDCSTIQIDSQGHFISTNPFTQRLLSAFFPSKGYFCLNQEKTGIFSFQNPTSESRNLLEKAQFLKTIGRIQSFSQMKDYVKTEEYQEVVEMVSSFLNLLQGYQENLIHEMNPYQQYLEKLVQKEQEMIKQFQMEFLSSCKEYLSEESKRSLQKGMMPEEYSNFLTQNQNTVFLNEKEEPLKPGIFESFLESPDPSNEETWNLVIDYLLKKGVSKSTLQSILLDLPKESWYQIKEVKEYLPDLSMVLEIKKKREKIQEKCYRSLLQLYTVNHYQVEENQVFDSTLKNILFYGEEKYAHQFQVKKQEHSSTIYLSPLDRNYAVADVTLDHELRHALESCILQTEQGIHLKTGLSISIFDSEYELGGANENIDEIFTQKLSLEATKNRQKRGIFILTEKEYARSYITSNYDLYFSNFDAVFPQELYPILLHSKIANTVKMPIYEVLSQGQLSEINSRITNLEEENKRILQQIGSTLLEQFEDKTK